jgi:metal-sulfur cluster biosynthetic enzyme
MVLYVSVAILILIVVAVVYANRRQARATLADAPPEPDIDLSYRPTVDPDAGSEPGDLLARPRDPRLRQLSTTDLVLEVLKECYDPEIPLNIVDLGLVYGVEATREKTEVRMSLTAPGCPSSETIKLDVRSKIEEAGFPNPKVEIVWEPRWTAHRISAEGRKKLGLEAGEDATKLIPQYPDPPKGSAVGGN